MRTPILFVLFFSLLSILSAQRSVSGSGNIVTEERKVANAFTKIEASNAIKVEIRKGKSTALSVEADDNLIQYVQTEVSGNTLSVRIKSNTNMRQTTKMIVYVTMPEIKSIDVSGAATVSMMSEFSGDHLDVEAGGAGQVKVDFVGRKVRVDVGGAGRVELRGSADEADYDASSAGLIDAKALSAKVVVARANSAGNIKLTATESLDAKANSAASIRYEGNPKKLYTDSNSAGSVRG